MALRIIEIIASSGHHNKLRQTCYRASKGWVRRDITMALTWRHRWCHYGVMNLTRYVDALQHQLVTAAEAGGTEAREIAQRLTAPLDAAVRLILLDALSVAAGEISAELAPGSVDVRLRGGDPEFVVAVPELAAGAPASASGVTGRAIAPSPVGGDEGTTTRTTLRLPDHLKTRVESAAARDGVSVNTWLVRAAAAALEPGAELSVRTEQRSGKRITGWVR